MKFLTVFFRDDLGIVSVKVSTESPDAVVFAGGVAFFTDADGRDYTVPVQHLIEIAALEE